MSVAGLLFSNPCEAALAPLAAGRTVAGIPYGGRYRLVDFPLSALAEAGVDSVGIVTREDDRALRAHIGTGEDWDISPRTGGVRLLNPSGAPSRPCENRVEALRGALAYVGAETLVLADCDAVLNLDLPALLAAHAATRADVTLVTVREKIETGGCAVCAHAGEDGRLLDLARPHAAPRGEVDRFTDVWVARRAFLQRVLDEAAVRGSDTLFPDAIARRIPRDRLFVFRHTGFYARIDSLAAYFRASVALLDEKVRRDLFGNPARPVLTKQRGMPPARYLPGCAVRDAVVADGCVIEGVVERAVLHRGVHVAKGAAVRDSVLLRGTEVSAGASLSCVVTDGDARILEGRTLSGHPTMPFFIGKGITV